jgi:hypothetical protein
LNWTVNFEMMAAELARVGMGSVCGYLINECKKNRKKEQKKKATLVG